MIFGTINEVSRSQIRLQNTPKITSMQAMFTANARSRFFAKARMQNGITRPQIISNQKNGAMDPAVSSVNRAMP